MIVMQYSGVLQHARDKQDILRALHELCTDKPRDNCL